jgi:hypothetical protein
MLTVAVGLWLAHSLPGQEPKPVQEDVCLNQQIATTIADHLRQSGQLRHYKIDILFDAGTATLTGSVTDQPQREEAVRIVQGVPGVERVLDRMNLGGGIAQVQAGAQPSPLKEPLPPKGPGAPTGPAEPMPVFQAAPPSPYDLNPPRMPPYAWPTYAPYNNYSRVAYPTEYPYQAWPFIGPFYPFPKVPLGWRSVKLEWEDGHWWFRKTACGHDWWHLRYW